MLIPSCLRYINCVKYLIILFYILPNHLFGQNKSLEICFSNTHDSKLKYILSYEAKITQNGLLQQNCIFLSLKDKGNYNFSVINKEHINILNISFTSDSLKTFTQWKYYLDTVSTTLLAEVVVKGGSRFIQKGDSLIIKTEGIDTRPHSNAMELLENIPGVNISNSGKVTIMGKSIDEILVDGKRIFGGNSKAVLDNVKSEMIEQLELSDFSKINDQNSVLNIKLKQDRKKGIYGDLEGGIGFPNFYKTSAKLNRFSLSDFLNIFGSTNNTNDLIVSENDLSTISQKTLSSRLKTPSSVIQNVINPFSEKASMLNYNSSNLNLLGTNRYKSYGVNGNLFRPKIDLNGYFLVDKRNNNLNIEDTRNAYIYDNQVVETKRIENSQNRKDIITGNIELIYRLNSKNTITSSFNLMNENISGDAYIKNRTSWLGNSTAYINGFIKSTSTNNFNNLSLAWVKKHNRPGMLTSLEWRQTVLNSQILLSNTNDSLTLDITQDIKSQSAYILGIQSYPINKFFLLEGRSEWIINHSDVLQNSFLGNHILTGLSGSFINSDNQGTNSAVLLFQMKKIKLTFGGSYWVWYGHRNNISIKKSLLTPLLASELKISKLSNINFKLGISNGIPSLYQTNPIPDSSQLQSVRIGNVNLNNQLEKYIKVSLNSQFRMLGISLNTEYKSYTNRVSNSSELLGYGVIKNSFWQPSQPLAEFSISANLFRFDFNSKYYWFLSGIYGNTQMITKVNNIDIPMNISFYNFIGSLDFKTANIKYNIALVSNTSSVSGNHYSFVNNIKARISCKLNTKNFLDLQGIYNLSINQMKSNSFSFLNFQFDHFMLNKQKLKISFIVKNIFDVQNITSISQNTNEIRINNQSYLGRVSLVSLTFYPSRWQ